MTAATRNPRHSGPSRRPPRTSSPSSPCPPSPSSSWQWPGPPQPPWGSSWCRRCVRGRSSPSPSMAACPRPRPCNRSPVLQPLDLLAGVAAAGRRGGLAGGAGHAARALLPRHLQPRHGERGRQVRHQTSSLRLGVIVHLLLCSDISGSWSSRDWASRQVSFLR